MHHKPLTLAIKHAFQACLSRVLYFLLEQQSSGQETFASMAPTQKLNVYC